MDAMVRWAVDDEVPGRQPRRTGEGRTAVASWRDQNPAGNAEQLIAAIGHRFHRDYDVVLRAVLFAVDRHRAHQATGVALPGQVR